MAAGGQEAVGAMFSRACLALFDKASSPAMRSEADRWITDFQKTSEAWAVVDTVLTANSGTLNEAFLAAKTFHTKLRFDYHEQVPPSERVALREKLLGHLVRQFGVPNRRAVATQLCLAVATLLLQMEEWEGAIKDLATRLGAQTNAALCLVELLQIIPEEHSDGSLNVSEERRAKISSELYDCGSDVVSFLERCMASAGADGACKLRCFKCLRAWVAIVEVPGEALAQSPLLQGLFVAISEGTELSDIAVSTVASILRKYCHREEPGHAAVMTVVVPAVIGLEPVFRRATQEEDDELATGVARVFIAMGEAFSRSIISEPNLTVAPKVLELVLLASSHSSYEVAATTWHFWQQFLERVSYAEHQGSLQGDINRFTALCQQLVLAALKHLEVPADHPRPCEVSASELDEEFFYNRRDIGDVLLKCCPLLTTAHVLTLIRRSLEAAASNLVTGTEQQHREDQQPGLEPVWRQVEALLFAANSVAEECSFTSSSSDAHVAVDYIFAVCLRLPNISVLLRQTVTRVFGCYAKFLRFNPQKLEPVVLYCLETLELVPPIGHTATIAVLKITEICCKDMMPVGTKLFQVCSSPKPGIKSSDRLDVLEALACIIAAQSHDQAVAAMQHVAQPAVQALQLLAEKIQRGEATSQLLSPGKVLEDIVFALRTLELLTKYGWVSRRRSSSRGAANGQGSTQQLPHPAFAVFAHVWPTLRVIASGLCDHGRIAERLAALFKVSIRAFDRDMEPYLGQLLELLVDCFQRTALSPYLYAAGIAMEHYSDNESFRPQLLHIVTGLSTKVFEVLGSEGGFVNNPDVVEDYFITMDRLTHAMTNQIVTAPFFASVFELAVNGALIEHRKASKTLLLYLETCLLAGADRPVNTETRPVIANCFRQHGQTLVSSLVAGVAGALARHHISSSREGSLGMTLLAVSRMLGDADRETFETLLANAVQSPRCDHVNRELGEWFVHEMGVSLYGERSESKYFDTLFEFSRRARLRLRRTVQDFSS